MKKMYIKSDFNAIFFKPAIYGQSDKGFLLTSKFCPQGVVCPFPRAIYIYKIIKIVYKIRLRRDHFETCNIWAKRKGLSVVINFLSPMGFLPLPGVIYMWNKHIKTVKNQASKRFFFKLATNGQSDKEFLLTSKVCPQWVVCPCPVILQGLYPCIKSFKMSLKSYFKEIVLKLATNGQSDKGFLLTPTFVPKGLSAPAMGLYTCIKALKYIPGPGVR